MCSTLVISGRSRNSRRYPPTKPAGPVPDTTSPSNVATIGRTVWSAAQGPGSLRAIASSWPGTRSTKLAVPLAEIVPVSRNTRKASAA
jgi:hypothetical protein